MSAARDQPLTSVVWSVTPEQTDSPYVRDIVDGLRSRGVGVTPISLGELWRSTGRVVHIQWPEHVSRGPGAARTAAKHVRALGVLAALTARDHRLVLTAHNRVPHGSSDPFDAWFRRQLYARADRTVVLVDEHVRELTALGQLSRNAQTVTIPHPMHISDDAGGRNPGGPLVVLGQIHPYHLIEPFLDALRSAGSTREVLVIGTVGDAALVDRLRARADDALEVRPGFVPEDELNALLRESSALVALQRNGFNTGGPFTGLPRGLPIVMSKSAQSRSLIEALGADWIFPVGERPNAENVGKLDEWLKKPRAMPDLDAFAIERVVGLHIELYELLRD